MEQQDTRTLGFSMDVPSESAPRPPQVLRLEGIVDFDNSQVL